MCKKLCVVFVLYVTLVAGHPAKDELMFDMGGDTAVVESTVREARAAVPAHIDELLKPGVKEAFLHSYGDVEKDDGNVLGYHKKSNDDGHDGYKHFDSYHKKDGDKYAFEYGTEYGQENKAYVEAQAKAHEDKAHYKDKIGDKKDDEEEGEESKKSYKIADEGNNKKGVSAVEEYEGEYYGDSGDSEGYSEGDGESEGYSEGDEGEGEHHEEGYEGEGDGESGGHYTEGDGDSEGYAEYDDGDESESYSEGDEEEGDY